MPSDRFRVLAKAVAPGAGTPGTHNPSPMGSSHDTPETKVIRHVPVPGTRGTPKNDDAGRGEATAWPILPPATPEQAADEAADR